MSGAVVSVLHTFLGALRLTRISKPGPRASLPDSPVAGVDEGQAEGGRDGPQLA